MIKIYQFFTLLAFFVGSISNAQENCVNFSTNDQNSTLEIFNQNNCVTISANTILNTIKIGNKSTIYIPKNISLKVNKIETDYNQELILNVEGILIIKENPAIKANILINNNGNLFIGENGQNNIELYGNTTKIINNGTIQLGKISFKGNDNLVQNNAKGNFIINGSLDIIDDLNHKLNFENYGHLGIAESYDNNKVSQYINCGIIEINGGFNLKGGKVINTGQFIQKLDGVISLGERGELSNYGYFKINGKINGNSSNTVHNEGRLIIKNFEYDGTLMGPSDDTKLGYIYIENKANANSGLYIGPNLAFRKITSVDYPNTFEKNTTYSSIFNSQPKYIDKNKTAVSTAELAGVSYGCTTCKAPEIYTNIPCPLDAKVCTKKPKLSGTPSPSTNGISSYTTPPKGWPSAINNGQLVLTSASKGFVLTRTTSDKILYPVEGMIIYDTQSNCLKMFTTDKGWNCLTKTCKND